MIRVIRSWGGGAVLGMGLAALLAVSPSAPAQAPPPGGWREITAGSAGIRMAIPPSWTEVSGWHGTGPALAASASGGLPSVAVIVRPASPGESLDGVTSQIAARQAGVLRGAIVGRPQRSRLGGREARRVEMAWDDRRRGPMEGVELIALRGAEAVIAIAQWARSPRARVDRDVAERVLATVTVEPVSRDRPGAGIVPHPPASPEAPSALTEARRAGGPRRNIFMEPPEAARLEGQTGSPAGGKGAVGGSSLPLPPVPEALGPGVALPPPPTGAAPVAKGAGGGQAGPPLPAVIGLVLGPTPEAVLVSGTSRTIVAPGAKTRWGTVVAVTREGVVLAAGMGRVTLRVMPRGGKACVEQSPSSSCS